MFLLLGTLRARFDLTQGPSTPSRIVVQFSCNGATISKLNFELKSQDYKLSLVKKKFTTGKTFCIRFLLVRIVFRIWSHQMLTGSFNSKKVVLLTRWVFIFYQVLIYITLYCVSVYLEPEMMLRWILKDGWWIPYWTY